MVPTIFVDLGRDMEPILWWGNVEKQQFGRLWMKVAFALAEPGLDWGTMTGDHWLVRLGVFNILVTLQGSTIMLQLDILGTKMFVVLHHLGHTGVEALHLLLEIQLHRRFLFRGIPTGGVALGIVAGLARHGRGVNLEKCRIFSREEGEDLRGWKNLQKTRRKKQLSSFGHRCGACQRLSDA
ncbi:unnamed protein product [Prunus brigantina]